VHFWKHFEAVCFSASCCRLLWTFLPIPGSTVCFVAGIVDGGFVGPDFTLLQRGSELHLFGAKWFQQLPKLQPIALNLK
jgi:hypothetical protein